MSQTIFIKKNLDILLLAIDSLDPYITDAFNLNFTINNKITNLLAIFTCRTSNCILRTQSTNFSSFYKVMIIISQILEVCSSSETQKNIFNILAENIENKNLYTVQTQNKYLKKFKTNYRKLCKPYLIGYDNYVSQNYIQQIGLVNLYILYKVTEPNNIYAMFSYLITNK
uniref:Uncharacterized protein n=1 Tax=Kumanoa mahlacensis TaxID=1196387 RepID=A0A8K1YUF8_9FLOR|nr:hypothetical protein [Kumanoa mahlacensis]